MKNKIKFHPCICERSVDDEVVQNGLAVTPSEMMRLTREGYSISSQNLRMLEAEAADTDFYVPLQYRRGMDISDLSEAAAAVRGRLKKTVEDFDSGKIQEVSKGKE